MDGSHDKALDRVKIALAFVKAKEKITASAPDCIASCSLVTVIRSPKDSVIVVYMDRSQGRLDDEQNLKHASCQLFFMDSQILEKPLQELHEYVERRVVFGIAKMQRCSLGIGEVPCS